MSIMREKPVICTEWFDIQTLTFIRNSRAIDTLSSFHTGKFFEDASDDLRTGVLSVSRNDRVYPDTIWDWLNPFKYPRFRLFQIENSCLLCKDLIE